jgi:hypothetical protein
MLVKEIKEIASQRSIDVRKMKKAEMVRAIQKHEGNTPCFQTGAKENCGQFECMWREDC